MSSKRVFGYLCDGEIEIASYTEDQYDSFKEALYNAFFAHECVCIATGLNQPENELGRIELTKLCDQVIEDGISIIARDVKNNKVVGFAVNKLQILPNPGEKSFFEIFKDDECQCEHSKALMDAMIYADGLVDVFKHYNTNCSFEIMFLGTDPAYGKRSIARVLCEYSIQLAKELSTNELTVNKPKIVTALFTSAFSQRIGQTLGFTEHAKLPYDECKFRDKTYTELLANPTHTSIQLVAFEL